MKTFRWTVREPKHGEPVGMLGLWGRAVSLISGEFLLNKRDNGGAIIALRSLLCSMILFSIAISLRYLSCDDRPDEALFSYILSSFASKTAWFGAIFAAVYAALYTRFASQWSYMANLYNQIKQASISTPDNQECLAEWKAGFIEDAEYLHLSHKENFVSIIYAWMEEEGVKKSYIKYTPGGETRWNALSEGVGLRYQEIVRQHGDH